MSNYTTPKTLILLYFKKKKPKKQKTNLFPDPLSSQRCPDDN